MILFLAVNSTRFLCDCACQSDVSLATNTSQPILPTFCATVRARVTHLWQPMYLLPAFSCRCDDRCEDSVQIYRVLLKMADDEIMRIKKESQPNDLLVAALRRQEQLMTHKAQGTKSTGNVTSAIARDIWQRIARLSQWDQ